MKTTLDLDDELVKAVKREAADSGRTMTDIIEQSLRESLLRLAAPKKPYRFKLPVVKGRRPPAVDINDRDALYDFMEGLD
jgi:Ribbon-helix-helix protein, copG family